MPGAGVFVAILAVLGTAAAAAADDCGVRYKNANHKPLLFGGVLDRCVAGCAPRTSQWGRICAFKRENDPNMVCTPSAANKSFALAETLGGGEAMQLSPCDLVRYLRGRTLWLIGDSHARFFYRALQCFMLDFWDHTECQATLDNDANAQLANMPAAPGGAYCFHVLGPATGRVCMVHVVLGTSLVENPQVAEGGVLPLLHKKFAQPQDIFYINFGIWHKNMEQHESSYLPALESLARFYKATKSRFPHVVFGETPAQHQRTGDGKQCAAARGFTYDPASGLLMTTPAVTTALRSPVSVAASSNARSAAVNTAAAANLTARAASNMTAGSGALVTTQITNMTYRVASHAPSSSAVVKAACQSTNSTAAATVDVTAAPAIVATARSTNATTRATARATASLAAGRKERGSTHSTASTAANVSAVAAADMPATAVAHAPAAAGASSSFAAAAAAAKATASLHNIVTGKSASVAAAGAADFATARRGAGIAAAAAGNATAAAAANSTASQSNRMDATIAGNVTARPAGTATGAIAGSATLLSVGNATTRPMVNAIARPAGNPASNAAAAHAAVLAANAAANAVALAANAAAAEQAATAYQQGWDLGIVTNQLANEVLARQGLPVLPFFNITVPLHDNHASIPLFSGNLDCMHYCHPGAPQMWVWYLYDFLRSPQGLQPLPNQADPNYTLPCRRMKSAA